MASGPPQAVVYEVLLMGSNNPVVRVLVRISIRETDSMQESTTEFCYRFRANDHSGERSVAREIYLNR